MTAIEPYPILPESLNHPAADAWLVDSSLSDSVDQVYICKAFRVGTTAGPVKVTTKNGTTIVIPNVQVGETICLRVTRFWLTGTTATGIMAYSKY